MRTIFGLTLALLLAPGSLLAQPSGISSEDVPAIEQMLNEFAENYNSGDYINASGAFTSQVERECGGPTDLAFALRQNHRFEQIDYSFSNVEPWDDEPWRADVTVVERWDDDVMQQALGFEFAVENGEWKMDELFPIGAAAYCG